MNAKINLISGEVYEFELSDESSATLLRDIRPREIFNRPLHQFLGNIRTVSINPSVVEWIEIETLEMPAVVNKTQRMTVRQLSADMFKHHLDDKMEVVKAVAEGDLVQTLLTAYGMATFRSGRSMYFEVTAKLERGADRAEAAQKIFQMPAILIYGEGYGLYIVNPANIAVWQVVPGLKKSSFFSVKSELKSVNRVHA